MRPTDLPYVRAQEKREFKRFDHAATTIIGIELAHQMKKGQFVVTALCSSVMRIPQVWEAVLAAYVRYHNAVSFAFALRIAPESFALRSPDMRG